MKTKSMIQTSLLIALMIAIIAISGCVGQPTGAPGGEQPGNVKSGSSILPSLGSWSMEKVSVTAPEGVSMEQGIYKSGDKAVILNALSGNENKLKNTLLALAHDAIEEPVTNEGLVGKSSATYMTNTDKTIHLLYFVDENKIGYLGIADDKSTLTDFFKGIFGVVLIE